MSRKDLGQDGELADYDGSECGRITPFSCYVRVMNGCPPNMIPREDRKKLVENWKKLKDAYRKYYTEMANTKCGGNWIDEDTNEYFNTKKGNKQKTKTYSYQPLITQQTPATQEDPIYSLDDLISKIESSQMLTSRKSPFDMDRW